MGTALALAVDRTKISVLIAIGPYSSRGILPYLEGTLERDLRMRRQKGRGAPRAPGLDRRSPYESLSLRDIYRINEQSPSRPQPSAPPSSPSSITRSTATTFSAEEQTRHINGDAKIPHDPVSLSVPTAYTGKQSHGNISAIGIARPLSSRDLRALGAQKARVPLPAITSGQTLGQTSHQQHKTSASDPTPSLPRKSTRAHPPVSLLWGAQHWNADAQEMESPHPRPRPNARPGSAGSITTTSGRSSFDSRAKSPLSTSSSVDSWETSRTSVESIMSNNSHTSVYQRTAAPMYAHGSAFEQAARREQMAPMPRYVPGTPTNLTTPPRLGASKNGIHVVGAEPAGIKYMKKTLGEGFKKLPEEILLVILIELRKLHLEVGSLSCATCWMRDCCNLGLSCKKWWSAAKRKLYEDIQLVGSDSILQTRKKYKAKYGTRLRLLRRTLRDHRDLADSVKVLKVPLIPETATTKKDKDEYLDLVASTIMACPNLERLPGFYPAYKHEFNHFVHALSTRTKLVEQVWVIDPNPFQRQHRLTLSDDSRDLYPALTPGALLPEQCLDFLSYHSSWDNLQTLFLHCNPGGTVNSALFTDITMSLPSLQHLHVSSFPSPAFNDDVLVSLPPLKSLRLESLSGITSNGLSTFVSLPSSNTLTNLSLISLPLLSLPVLARVLSRLRYLESFTISQSPSPSLPPGEDIFMHPYLASSSLTYLHWEITSSLTDMATEILAKSIQFQGFPSLRTLRAPADFDGTLQALCKPREKIELPGDRYRNITIPPVPSSQSMPIMAMSSPTSTRSSFFSSGSNSSQTSFATSTNPIYARSLTKSPTKSRVSIGPEGEESESIGKGGRRSLAQARRQAQARIEAAEKHPQFHIIIWDEEGHFVERHAVGGFVGQVQSKIFYSLKPDVEGMDEAVVGVSMLLDDGDETAIRDGCTGSWNLSSASKTTGGKIKSSGKERWSHTQRGRWREVKLEKFF